MGVRQEIVTTFRTATFTPHFSLGMASTIATRFRLMFVTISCLTPIHLPMANPTDPLTQPRKPPSNAFLWHLVKPDKWQIVGGGFAGTFHNPKH